MMITVVVIIAIIKPSFLLNQTANCVITGVRRETTVIRLAVSSAYDESTSNCLRLLNISSPLYAARIPTCSYGT